MNTKDVPKFKVLGFDNDKYVELQTKAILERISKFPDGKLYLEIGGKLIEDPHAARVLPGFKKENKVDILKNLGLGIDILFCLDYEDILTNRQLSNKSQDYTVAAYSIVKDLIRVFGVNPKVVINKIKDDSNPLLQDSINLFEVNGLEVYKRYYIEGYPSEPTVILSDQGYGKDEYIDVKAPLVVVTGAASNSGKMSTCLGQMYLDKTVKNINSGYAKYETFPIWNLDLDHPVNLAYEAATADIGDRNVIDIFHLESYGESSVNYNRDVQAFSIIKALTQEFLDESNFVTQYKSPTDMGINMAGYTIKDDKVVCQASFEEIQRRKGWYRELVDQGIGKSSWVKICEELEKDAIKYIKKNYPRSLNS